MINDFDFLEFMMKAEFCLKSLFENIVFNLVPWISINIARFIDPAFLNLTYL